MLFRRCGVLNGNAAYITLDRDSAEYAIVRRTLNSSASWGSRPRGSFNHEDEQHEYTAPDCTLLRGLLFLVSLVWFLYLIRRKSQSSSLTLRKSGRQI